MHVYLDEEHEIVIVEPQVFIYWEWMSEIGRQLVRGMYYLAVLQNLNKRKECQMQR